MIDLSTSYLGLTLKNPLVPSSSPFSRVLEDARRLEDAGAAALVMHSLFEEETQREEQHYERFLQFQSLGHAEAQSFHPEPVEFISHLDQYLEQLQCLKSTLEIPVIASLNGVSLEGWLDHAHELQRAGADAIELNAYYVAADADETAQQVEQRYLDILGLLREQIHIPIAMKLSSQFSCLSNFVRQLEAHGVNGVSLFNRFYQPDIDLETLKISHSLEYSGPAEALLRIRWAGILRDQVKISLAVTGGFHHPQDMIKALLSGADIVHLCSALLVNGPEHITTSLKVIYEWMQEKEYRSVEQLKGSISRACALNPADYERANYFQVMDSHQSSPGVLK